MHYVDTQQCPEMTAQITVVTYPDCVKMFGTISTDRGMETQQIGGSQLAKLMAEIMEGRNPADAYFNHCR